MPDVLLQLCVVSPELLRESGQVAETFPAFLVALSLEVEDVFDTDAAVLSRSRKRNPSLVQETNEVLPRHIEQIRGLYNQPCPATLDVTGWQPTSFLFTPTGPSAWPEVFGSVALEGTQVTTVEVGGTGKCEPGSMEAAVATLSLFPHEQVRPFLANASLAVRGRWTPPGHLSAEGHVRPVQVDPLPHPPWRPEQIIHPCSSPHRWVGEVTVTVHIPGAPYDPVPGKVSLDFGCPGQVHPSETLPAAVDAGAATNDEPGGGCTSSAAALNGLAVVLLAVIGLRPHRWPRRAR